MIQKRTQAVLFDIDKTGHKKRDDKFKRSSKNADLKKDRAHGTAPVPTAAEEEILEGLRAPSAYTGLYGFHKYWGKKPVEPLRFLISALTERGDIVVDPFLGSGAIAKEAAQLGRRFIGGDINPTAIRLSHFFVQPCAAKQYKSALAKLEEKLRQKIDSSYFVEPFGVTSHNLWRREELLNVWQRIPGKRTRKERMPTAEDVTLFQSFESYIPKVLRPLRLFHNGRINTLADISWKTLFSGRALRNIELLVEEIRKFPDPVRQALELTLTSSVGQMSKMVFAITSRGKTKGVVSERIEIGSWVIGYWRPETHFEINVWNCFEAKAKKLEKALSDDTPTLQQPSSFQSVMAGESLVSLIKIDALALIKNLPSASIHLLITDPPHGDRVPYLELSEMWNGILDEESLYEQEVVISNAKGRDKSPDRYRESLDQFFSLSIDRLQSNSFLVLLFNSRKDDDWRAIRGITDNPIMKLTGCFPMEYSARSVVQDNREGGMKTDYIMVFAKGHPSDSEIAVLRTVPGWRNGWPE